MTVMKRCRACMVEKPPESFYPEPRVKSGLTARCIDCCLDNARRWRQAHRDRRLEHGKRYCARRPERQAAREAARAAIAAGVLVREPCLCGASPAQAHHDDYAYPLEVRWLCASHHRMHHVRLASSNLTSITGGPEPLRSRASTVAAAEAASHGPRSHAGDAAHAPATGAVVTGPAVKASRAGSSPPTPTAAVCGPGAP